MSTRRSKVRTGPPISRNQRGTLNPSQEELVHIKYKCSGVKAWEKPSIARVAIARGQAVEVVPGKSKSAKKK